MYHNMPENTTWNAVSLPTTTASGRWTPITTAQPNPDTVIGQVVSPPTGDGNTAVIRLTNIPTLHTEPSHPSYTYRTTLPTIEPAPANFDGTFHFEGNAPELIEQLQDMMAPGSRLVVNNDSIFCAQGPPRTVQYTYSADTSPSVKTKKTRKPRKKQEKIKTIKDQMKDIP